MRVGQSAHFEIGKSEHPHRSQGAGRNIMSETPVTFNEWYVKSSYQKFVRFKLDPYPEAIERIAFYP